MESTLMPQRHRNAAPWVWQIAGGQAATLQADSVPRWLRVESGLVWVTAREAGPHGDDLWLESGASLELPPGTTWVLQAWPQARLSLAVQAGVSHGAGGWAALRAWLGWHPHATQRRRAWTVQPQ